jgi:cytochrome b561
VDYQMQRMQDGGDYRNGGGIRGRGPSLAIRKGANDIEGATRLAQNGVWLAWGLVIFAGLHGLAALKHHFIDRDATLVRMLGRKA